MDNRKVEAIRLFFEKEHSQRSIARLFKIDKQVIACWIEIYRYHGMEGLLAPPCPMYEESFKLKVVQHMIETAESFTKVVGRFNIPGRATIWKWMKRYMSNEDWALYHIKRERRNMKKKQSQEELTEVKKLQEELEYLKIENAYLKKLQALVQEKELAQRKKK